MFHKGWKRESISALQRSSSTLTHRKRRWYSPVVASQVISNKLTSSMRQKTVRDGGPLRTAQDVQHAKIKRKWHCRNGIFLFILVLREKLIIVVYMLCFFSFDPRVSKLAITIGPFNGYKTALFILLFTSYC